MPEKRYFAITLSLLSRGYNEKEKVFDNSLLNTSNFPDQFLTLNIKDIQHDIHKANNICNALGIKSDRVVIIEIVIDVEDLQSNKITGIGAYIKKRNIKINKIFDSNFQSHESNWTEMQLKEALKRSMEINSVEKE